MAVFIYRHRFLANVNMEPGIAQRAIDLEYALETKTTSSAGSSFVTSPSESPYLSTVLTCCLMRDRAVTQQVLLHRLQGRFMRSSGAGSFPGERKVPALRHPSRQLRRVWSGLPVIYAPRTDDRWEHKRTREAGSK